MLGQMAVCEVREALDTKKSEVVQGAPISTVYSNAIPPHIFPLGS